MYILSKLSVFNYLGNFQLANVKKCKWMSSFIIRELNKLIGRFSVKV